MRYAYCYGINGKVGIFKKSLEINGIYLKMEGEDGEAKPTTSIDKKAGALGSFVMSQC